MQISAVLPRQAPRPGITHSLPFQLITVLVVGVFLPTFGLVALSASAQSQDPVVIGSLIAGTIAAVTLVFASWRIAFYPSRNVTSYILPLSAIIYGLVLSAILVSRIEYSSRILLLTFLATTFTRYAVAAWNGQVREQVFMVVPTGRTDSLRRLAQLNTHFLATPQPISHSSNPIIVDLHYDLTPEWERFLAESAISGVPVYHYKHILEAITGKVQVQSLSENVFGTLVPNLSYSRLKRFTDVLLVIAAAPVLLLVLAIVAGLIKADSPGPVFFRQTRMGYQGKTFKIIKFRTMDCACDGADADVSITQTNDQRITRIGAFLRRTRIDELPQALNILRGEMSWIGPRPEAISLSRRYEEEIPFYRYRHIVRPGITGWAQVNQGHVTDIDEIHEKLSYDFYYIKNFSYWLDLLVFFKTIRVVFTGFGAK